MRDHSTEDTSDVTSGECHHKLFAFRALVAGFRYNMSIIGKKCYVLLFYCFHQLVNTYKEFRRSFRSRRISSWCMGFDASTME